MRSGFYYQGHHRKVAANIREYINSSRDFLSLGLRLATSMEEGNSKWAGS